MDIDRRAFLASVGGLAVVERSTLKPGLKRSSTT